MQGAVKVELESEEAHQAVSNQDTPIVSVAGMPYSGGELISKNIRIGKKRTSIRLEPEMWEALDLIIKKEKILPAYLFDQIFKAKKKNAAFTAALRGWILSYFVSSSGLGS